MTASTRRILAALLALVLTAGGANAAPIQADAPALADSAGVSAFILTISGNPLGVVTIPVSEIRATVSRELSSTLLKWGPIVPPETVMGVMEAWRVRDGRSISRGFLDSLAIDLKVRRLLIANLVVDHNRVTMAARHIDPVSARLLEVAVEERFIDTSRGADPDLWITLVREITRIAADVPPMAPDMGRPPLLTLETRAVGCSDSDALIASHILLAHHLENGPRIPIDPAVVNATLHDAGYSERYLGADARTLLRGTFNCRLLMIPQLISYAPERRAATQSFEYDDRADRRGPLTTDFAMSLRLIDLESGSIRAGMEAFMPVPTQAGWFGVQSNDTLLDRMKIAADRLWDGMHNALEAF
jgi:hypothetical protein